ncbi:winged helix-turn-helix transcriptional regulator [Candidatus Dojkabacteria bacterium]|nr:winged helix-turn-helix transcriptional regulator [Candidatus Dojkabacteria bacterium]
MKRISRNSKYYYPLTEKTTNDIFRKIFRPLASGHNVTVRVAYRFGGGISLIRFLVSEVDKLAKSNKVNISTNDQKIIIIDPNEMSEDSKHSYMNLIYRKLLEKCCPGRKPKAFSSYSELLDEVRREVSKCQKKYEIIFVLRGIGFLEFAYKFMWGNIRSLREADMNPSRVRFLFLVYEEAPYQMNSEKFALIRDLMKENIVEFGSLPSRDVDYLVTRWGYILDKKFTRDEQEAIKKVSRGYPYLIKYAAMSLENRPEDVDLMEFLNKNAVVQDIVSRLDGKKNFAFDPNTGDLFVEGVSVVHSFSPAEYNAVTLLAKMRGKLVSKEQIAEAIWPGESLENYSDWAITQLIKRLRKKLRSLGVEGDLIKTVHGRGYMLK